MEHEGAEERAAEGGMSMGVYIKGMEMPKSCRDCDFMNWGAVEPNRCGITDCFIGGDYDKRHDNCPLVPVPPHGDLIDRDPFVQFIKSHWDSSDQWFVEQLEARPTIIPAEEGEA